MKKSKLIFNLCLLVLTFACLTFGVYSAVKTSFTASGSITFNAYGLDVVVEGTITGVVANGTDTISTTFKGATLSNHGDSSVTVGSNGNLPTWSIGKVKFDELNEVIRSFVTIKVTNYSEFGIEAKFGTCTVPTGITSEAIDVNTTYIYGKKYSDVDADVREMMFVMSAQDKVSAQSFAINIDIKPSTLVEDTDVSHYNFSGGVISCVVDQGTMTTYGYTGANTDLVIPQKINGVKVTSITNIGGSRSDGEGNFSQARFTSFIVPNTVSNICLAGVYTNKICLPMNSIKTTEDRCFDGGFGDVLYMPASITTVTGQWCDDISFKTVVLPENFVSNSYGMGVNNCYVATTAANIINNNSSLDNFCNSLYVSYLFDELNLFLLDTTYTYKI